MIIQILEAQNNEYYKQVRILDSETFLVHSYLYPEKIHRLRKYQNSKLTEEFEFKEEIRTEVVNIEENKIRVFTQNKVRIIDFNGEEKIIPIVNPHLNIADRKFSHYVHAEKISEDEFLLTIQKPGYGDSYYARYFSILKLENRKSGFPFYRSKTSAKWTTNIIQPSCDLFSPLYYNTGFHAKLPQDWLSIISVGFKDENILFYSNGGSSTRTKSGPRYECSEIGILNRNLEVLKVIKVHLGMGQFSSDSKCFIQQEYKNERNLHVYNLTNFEFYTIRTTPKTHLGTIKRYGKVDKKDNKLIMYDFKNITFSEVKSN